MQWFRRSLIAGFFVTVPLVVSVTAFVWIFRAVDGFMGPLFARWWSQELPGLGLLITVLGLLIIGTLATNVFGKRVLEQVETYLLKIPVFKTIYAPVKQLTTALSPDNKYGFKRVVLIEDMSLAFSQRNSYWIEVVGGSRFWRSTFRPIIFTSVMYEFTMRI